MIEIACQTYSLRSRPLGDMLACVRKAGFRAVELWVGHADHSGGVAGATRVRSAAEETGVAIHAYSVGGFVRTELGLVEDKLASAFAFARALRVDLVTGVVDRRAVPVVDRLCRRTGIRFAIENHWYAEFARVEDYEDTLRTASPLVGVTLDTGHLLAARQRPTSALAALGDRIFDVHLKDGVIPARLERWLLRRPRLEPRTVGTGDGDLLPFLGALAERGYRGCLAIEDERPEVPLSELQASLRAAVGILRRTPQPLAPPGSVECTFSS
jgi:sugar phosphate isomerase/epimerase